MSAPVVLEVEDLTTEIRTPSGTVRAVDGVSFELREGETLGLVGESGSGKSMTSLSLIGLLPRPAAEVVAGRIVLDGVDLTTLSPREMQKLRGSAISMILQDPMTSLDPVFTIGDQGTEAMRDVDKLPAKTARDRFLDFLKKVRISDPEARLASYPHQLSGGMRQRVVGAIAISRHPRVLIADEPTTSLDATIQLQFLRVLKDLQRATGVAIIFITHDFGIVSRMCDRVAVMYAGRIVEVADVETLFAAPAHPYTQALIASVPDVRQDVEVLPAIEGQPPRAGDLPIGCSFAPRCPLAFSKCEREYPPEFALTNGTVARCWKLDERQ